MRYLHLRFNDAGLFIENGRRVMGGRKVLINDDNFFSAEKYSDYPVDIKTPIGVKQISNMLHVMLGLAPIPSKRNSALTNFKEEFQNKEIYDLAKNHSFINYYTSYIYDDSKDRSENMKELKKYSSAIQMAKPSQDTNMPCTTYFDGKEINGNYNWDYFIRRFRTKEDIEFLNKIFFLFNKVTGKKDVTKEFNHFTDFAKEFRKHSDDKTVIDFLETYKSIITKKGSVIGGPFLSLIFKKKFINGIFQDNDIINSNTSYYNLAPLFNNKGVDYSKVNFSGEIIVEIENDEIINRLHEYGSIPTILDGGLIEVIGCKKMPPCPDWKQKYSKISEENVSEVTENQQVM